MPHKPTPSVLIVVVTVTVLGVTSLRAQHCPNLGASGQEVCVVFQEFPTGAGPIVWRGSNPLVVPDGTTIGNYTVDLPGLTFTLSPTGEVQSPGFALAVNGTIRRSGGGGTTLAVVAHGGLFQPPVGPWKGDLVLLGTSTTALSVIQLGGGTGYDVDLDEPQVAPFSRIVEESVWSPGAFGGTVLQSPIALAPVSVVLVLAVNIPEANGSITVPATVGVGPDGLAPAAPVGDAVDVLLLAVPPAGVVERFPLSQFTISNDGTCSESHYHTMLPSVSSLEGAELTDPDPLGCGFGRASEVGVATVHHFTGTTTLASDFPVSPLKDLVIGSNAVLTLPSGLGISNHGIITVARTGAVVVNGEFLNEGIVNNFGDLDVYGALLNKDNAEVINRDGATVLDVGSVDNYGFVSNAGLVDIDGILRNLCDAIYDDTGVTEGSITPVDCLGCPGEGSCCAQQPTAACQDLSCCLAVCLQDADCCTVEWDDSCAQLAGSTCDTCNPQGACCTVDPPACTFGPPGDCTGPGQTYLGDGVACFPDWCAAPPAGCCLGGGCVTMPLAECMEAQGQVVTSCQEANACPASTCEVQPIPLDVNLDLSALTEPLWWEILAGSGGGLVIDACPNTTIQAYSGPGCGELTPIQDSGGSCSMCIPTSGCGPIVIQLENPSEPPFNVNLDCYEVTDCGSLTPQPSTCNPITIGAGRVLTDQDLQLEGHSQTIEVLFANSDPGATHTAQVDWGDGFAEPADSVAEPTRTPEVKAGRVTSSHSYRDNGTYTVTVNVTDSNDITNAHSFDITIGNVAPTVYAYEDRTTQLRQPVKLGYQEGDVLPPLARRPGKISFNDRGTDNPFAPSQETFRVIVDWDDLSQDEYVEPDPHVETIDNFSIFNGTSGFAVLVHTYSSPSPPEGYNVTVTVIDDDGGVGTDQVIVHVVAGDCNNDTIPDDQQLNGPCVDQSWWPEAPAAPADLDCEDCCCVVSIIADNFAIFEATTITGIRWHGEFFPTANEQTEPQNFTVNIREDAGGSPSTLAPPLVTFSGVPTGRDSTGIGHYYEVVLDAPLELPPGTYWIEIYNDTGPGTPVTWYWRQALADPEHSLPGSRFAVTNPPAAYINFTGVHYFSFELICQGANDVLPPGGDGVPDDCSFQDCNANQQRDADEIVADPSLDCNADGYLDECQSACTFGVNTAYSTDDCDCTGVPDFCETGFTAPDCNANTIPDACDGDTCFTVSLSNSAANNSEFLCQQGPTLFVTRDNNYARCWNPAATGVTGPFEITGVRFAVRTFGPGILPTEVLDDISVAVAIHEDDDGCPPIHENIDLVPMVSTQRPLSAADANSLVEVSIPPTLLDPAKDYVVTISVPDLRGISGFVSIGMNNSGASGPTYKRSGSCQEFEYETIQSQGAPANRVLAGLRISGCYPLENDDDGDGVPNECEEEEIPPAPQAEPGGQSTNRFAGVVVPPAAANRGPGQQTALRVTLTTLNHPRRCCSGQDGNGFGTGCNVNAPCDLDGNCSGGTPLCRHQLAQGPPTYPGMEGNIRYVNSFPGGSLLCADDGPPFNTTYRCATLGCEPEYRDWAADLGVAVNPSAPAGLIYITGDAIVPSSTLHVQHIAASCGAAPGANTCSAASVALAVGTAAWGDITSAGFSSPDGKSDVLDIPAVTNKLKGVPTFFSEPRTWLKQRDPAANTEAITVVDLSDVVDGVLAKPYPASRTIDACSHD